MRFLSRLTFIVAIWYASSLLAADVADVDVIDGALGQSLHERITARADKGFSGTLLVAKGGKVIIAKGYGFADRAAQIPFTSATAFDIGSITKQFTGAAIAKLEMQGKVNAQDQLSKYVSNMPEDKAEITLFHLLTHSAGFESDFGGDYEVTPRDVLVERALNSKLRFKPGTVHRYSNSGFSLLATVVEKASGRPYEQYLREELLLPAGLKHTGYRLPDWKSVTVAHGYRKGADWGTPLDQKWGEDGPYWNLRGNGGILSTVWDLYRWHQALMDDKILPAEIKDRMYARLVKEEPDSQYWYSYGWSLNDTPQGTRIIEHNGGNGIFFADFVRYVDDDIVIIAASNRSETSNGAFVREIRQLAYP